MSADRFDDVLPAGRGSSRDEARAARSPIERARELVAEMNAGAGSVLEMVGRERRVAEQLGLQLVAGSFTGWTGHGRRWAMSAVYCDDEFIGFVDICDHVWLLLRCDDVGAPVRCARAR